ncbi:MAG: protein BatD [Bacteroidetes bacterium]|nr:protein BatD [Bacteroidota bacterium]
MKQINRYITIVLLCTLYIVLCTSIYAQKFTASASKTVVAVGEQFQITFAINTSASSFKAPSLNEFDVYSGPNQSQSMQFVNGNMSQSISFSYIIAAKKEGKYTIAPASVNADGKKVESNSMVIEVVKGSGNAGTGGGNQRNSNSSSQQTANDNLFAKTTVSKTKVYVGEQIMVSHKIYTRLNLRGFQDYELPSYNGFWSQDVVSKGQIELTTENIDGAMYQVAELKKVFLFPQRSGTLEIEPVEVTCIVRERSSNAPQSIFDQFFGGGGYKDVSYKIKSRPVKIDVSALPEANKPKDFSGAVGNYTMKTQLSKEKLKVNDAINLVYTISGRGNLKLIDAPAVNFPQEFEKYDPKVTDNVSVSSSGVAGSKTFDYLLIAREQGTFKLDALSFSYFDPEKKSYVTLPAPEFSIQVDPSDNKDDTKNVVITSVTKESVKQLGSDIRYIKTNSASLRKQNEFFFGSGLFYAGIAFPGFLALALILVKRSQDKANSNVVALKSRKANKIAQKRLSVANQFVKENKRDLFCDEIFKALYGYLSDKFSIPISNLSKDSIKNTLDSMKVKEESVSSLLQMLNTCEMARYAPSAVEQNLIKVYEDTVTIITNIENEIA